jgi:hypothetical protein
MHYATSREVSNPIADEGIGFFNLPNPSSRTMSLESTQPLTEMSTRNLSGGKGRPARKANNFTAICEPTVYKMWEPRRLTTYVPTRPVTGISLPLLLLLLLLLLFVWRCQNWSLRKIFGSTRNVKNNWGICIIITSIMYKYTLQSILFLWPNRGWWDDRGMHQAQKWCEMQTEF